MSNVIFLTDLPFPAFPICLPLPRASVSASVLIPTVWCLCSSELLPPACHSNVLALNSSYSSSLSSLSYRKLDQKLIRVSPTLRHMAFPSIQKHLTLSPSGRTPFPFRVLPGTRAYVSLWQLRFSFSPQSIQVFSSHPPPGFSFTGSSSSALPLIWITWIETAGAHISASLFIKPCITEL